MMWKVKIESCTDPKLIGKEFTYDDTNDQIIIEEQELDMINKIPENYPTHIKFSNRELTLIGRVTLISC